MSAASFDARDREIARLISEIAKILPHEMSVQVRAAFEMALTIHLNGI